MGQRGRVLEPYQTVKSGRSKRERGIEVSPLRLLSRSALQSASGKNVGRILDSVELSVLRRRGHVTGSGGIISPALGGKTAAENVMW